jgi:hypothetical protein
MTGSFSRHFGVPTECMYSGAVRRLALCLNRIAASLNDMLGMCKMNSRCRARSSKVTAAGGL